MKLAVIIPCLNEEKTIAEVIGGLPSKLEGVSEIRVFVVDDGSEDGTSAAAEKAGARVIRFPKNMGLGTAFAAGVAATLEYGADVVVNIDGDGQFDGADVPKIAGPIIRGEADFVTASRFKDKALIPEMPPIKRWGNHRMSQLISFLTNQKFKDVSCGFRGYSREALMRLNLMGRYTYTQETFLEMVFRGFKILEVPVKVRGTREHGSSRIASSVLKYAWNTSIIILRSYRDYRPFLFFGVPALALLFVAFCLALFFFDYYLLTGRFTGHLWAGFTSAYLGIMGFALLIVSLFTDMSVRMRKNQEELLYLERKKLYDRRRFREIGEAMSRRLGDGNNHEA